MPPAEDSRKKWGNVEKRIKKERFLRVETLLKCYNVIKNPPTLGRSLQHTSSVHIISGSTSYRGGQTGSRTSTRKGTTPPPSAKTMRNQYENAAKIDGKWSRNSSKVNPKSIEAVPETQFVPASEPARLFSMMKCLFLIFKSFLPDCCPRPPKGAKTYPTSLGRHFWEQNSKSNGVKIKDTSTKIERTGPAAPVGILVGNASFVRRVVVRAFFVWQGSWQVLRRFLAASWHRCQQGSAYCRNIIRRC